MTEIPVVIALKSTCCLRGWHWARRSREAYCRGTGLGGESGCSKNTWNWRMLQVKTEIWSLGRRNSVNILLLICIFFHGLLFLSYKFLLLSTHLFIPTHPPSKLLLPHSCKMAILQSSKMLCMWKGCRIHTWAFVLNKEMCHLHVLVLYPQNRIDTLIFPPLIIFHNMRNVVWQYFHVLEKRNSKRNGKDLANDSSASHSCNPRQLLRKPECPCAEGPWCELAAPFLGPLAIYPQTLKAAKCSNQVETKIFKIM